MSRFVDPIEPGARLFSKDDRAKSLSDYTERVAKYVPAELVALYLSMMPIINSTTTKDTFERNAYLLVLFAVTWVFTPIYLLLIGRNVDTKRVQIIMSTIAFPIWAYSIGGYFTAIQWYRTFPAVFLIAIFTLISGAIRPIKEK
jgi:hypothetical protein